MKNSGQEVCIAAGVCVESFPVLTVGFWDAWAMDSKELDHLSGR
jgi:hypothetical protein